MLSGNIVTFEGPGIDMKLQRRPLPDLQPGEILVRNLYTTICGSDLHTFCGLRQEKTPTVLGHEIVGQIVKVHEEHPGYDYAGHELHTDDIVTWSIFSSDPGSEWSKNGMPQKGPKLFKYGHAPVTDEDAFHGGLADYCILKKHTAVLKLPETLPLPVAATINCAIATVAGALRLAGDLQEKNVLITGMGLLGMAGVAMCREAGAGKIYAADIHAARLQQSLSFGADEIFLLQNVPEDFRSFQALPKGGIDVVFDMSGAPAAMEAGIDMLAVGGTAVWIGAVFRSRKVQVDAEQVIRRLISIKGLHNYNYEDFAYAVRFIVAHHQKYPFSQVVSKEFPLSETVKAFEYALEHKPLRVGIHIGL